MRENRVNKDKSGSLPELNISIEGLGIGAVVRKCSIDVKVNPQFLGEGGESK